jgi:toxin CcdB
MAQFSAKAISKLNPIVTINGVEYMLVFQDLAAVPTAALGDRIESLASRRADLVGAIDLLFTGI